MLAWLHRHPLLVAVVAFTLGMAAGRLLDPLAGSLIILLGAGLIAWGLLEWRWPTRAWSTVALLVALLAGGAAWWQLAVTMRPHTDLALRVNTEGVHLATVRGVLLTTPKTAHASSIGEPRFRALMELTHLRQGAAWITTSGQAQCYFVATSPPERGTTVEADAFVSRITPPHNPGEFDLRHYWAAAGIDLQVACTHVSQFRPLAAGEGGGNILDTYRNFLAGRLRGYLVTEDETDPTADTLAALVLGQRGDIPAVTEAFQRSGLMHLLAISGGHIIVVAGLLAWVLRLLVARPWPRTILVTLGVVAYVLATPCDPPVVRAGIACVVILGGLWLARRVQPLNLLALAWLLVMLWRPHDLTSAGCQLSFLCTAGLLLLASPIYHALAGVWLPRWAAIARASQSWYDRGRTYSAQTALVMLSANLAGCLVALPLLALHFNQFTPWAILTGILALPLVTVALLLGLVQLTLALLVPPLAALFAPIAHVVTVLMNAAIQSAAALPAASSAVPAPPGWLVGLFYVGLILWLVLHRGPTRRWLWHMSLFIVGIIGLWYAGQRPTAPAGWVLDTNGSCLVLRDRRGGVHLINLEAPRQPDFARRTLRPVLQAWGTTQVQSLTLMQASPQTAPNLTRNLAILSPEHILLSTNLLTPAHPAGPEVTANVRFSGRVPTSLSRGTRIQLGPELAYTCLWPPADIPTSLPQRWRGTALRVELGTTHILVTEPQLLPLLRYLNPQNLRSPTAIILTATPQTADLAELSGAVTCILPETSLGIPALRPDHLVLSRTGALAIVPTPAGALQITPMLNTGMPGE
ncbi:MAG: ComEC/Rec2 family competence protein [Phycisphaerae bacterium]